MNRVTLTAGDLRRSLAATIPAASADVWLPELAGIVLYVTGEQLLATATDRYVAAHAKCPIAEGALRPATLQLNDAKFLATLLRRPMKPPLDLVTVERLGDTLEVTYAGTTVRLRSGEPAGWFAQANAIFTGASTKKNKPAPGGEPIEGRIDLGVDRLRSLGRVLAAAPAGTRVRWRILPSGGPVLVDLLDWLLVVVMPMRPDPDEQHVLVTLPEPAPVAKAVRAPKVAPVKAAPSKVSAKATTPRRRAS
jgi:hypothetical protein